MENSLFFTIFHFQSSILETQKHLLAAYGESLLKKEDFKLLIPAQTVPAGK